MDEWDQELGASALRVQPLLETKAFAYTMVGASHLAAWTTYVRNFFFFMQNVPVMDSGRQMCCILRGSRSRPTAMREVFALCFAGHALEDALSPRLIATSCGICFASGPRAPKLKRVSPASQQRMVKIRS